jgi:hypothetical protein
MGGHGIAEIESKTRVLNWRSSHRWAYIYQFLASRIGSFVSNEIGHGEVGDNRSGPSRFLLK